MIALNALDYTAIRWDGPSQPIMGLSWLSSIDSIYAVNPVTSTGFIGYTRGARFSSLMTLTTGGNYLVYANAAFSIDEASAAPTGAFAAFVGYTPPTTTPTTPTPVTGPGFIATAIAARPIIGGSIVARTAEGLVPHSAKTLDLIHLNFGIALNNALPGGQVSVQRGGYVLYPGLGLRTDATLFVGDNGKLATSSAGMAFSQIVGRAISPDEFIYQPESAIILYPFSLLIS